MKAELHVCQVHKSVCCPKQPVAYAALYQVNVELSRLQKLNIITPVDNFEFVAPIRFHFQLPKKFFETFHLQSSSVLE